ncbi:MAG: dipeptidase [Candidatus Dormibacteraeota bacterium]|nr:dipeptidase [Candidatus Dormibacteraeota bacterium]
MSRPALEFGRRQMPRFVAELREFVGFPTVSSAPEQQPAIAACAEWLGGKLREAGMPRVEILENGRHPVVYGEAIAVPELPTLLVYGHFDVQPPGPAEEWLTPPFQATIRGRDLYGRGASDDKGPLFVHVKAIECFLASGLGLPVNVRVLFESGEEVGSPGLRRLLESNRGAMAADAVVVSDTRMLGPRIPAVTYSLRGSLACELRVSRSSGELHSGAFGGMVRNPLEVLAGILARLHDSQGRVAVPGFYDSVRRVSSAERRFMAAEGPSNGKLLVAAGVDSGWGEPGFTAYERVSVRPALTVNGISGGHQSAGGKAVIPASGAAKFSFRLVPDQSPAGVERLLRQHLQRQGQPGMEVRLAVTSSARPAVLDRRHPVSLAASAAYRAGFGVDAVFVRSGGTIPVVNDLMEVLGAPVALMGFALPDDRMHAANERFHLPAFAGGLATSIDFMERLRTLSPQTSRGIDRFSSTELS